MSSRNGISSIRSIAAGERKPFSRSFCRETSITSTRRPTACFMVVRLGAWLSPDSDSFSSIRSRLARIIASGVRYSWDNMAINLFWRSSARCSPANVSRNSTVISSANSTAFCSDSFAVLTDSASAASFSRRITLMRSARAKERSTTSSITPICMPYRVGKFQGKTLNTART